MQMTQVLVSFSKRLSSEGCQGLEKFIQSVSSQNRENHLIPSEKQCKYTFKEKKFKSLSIIQTNIILDTQILEKVLAN